MSKTVMILGAGASIPFFSPCLTTDALTRAVQEKNKWKSLLERYTAVMDSGVDEVHWEPIQCLIKQARNVNKDLNFEELIEFVDKYSSYAFGDKRLYYLLKFFKVKLPLEYDHYWQSWSRVPLLFRQMIAESIEKWDSKYRSADYCNLLTKQSEFILEQLQQGATSVYSFNYDDVLPQTVLAGKIPLETGFVCERFNSVKFLQAPSVLAFPHGHAKWTQDDCGIKSFTSISAANRWRLDHLNDPSNAETTPLVSALGAYDFNTFLTTGQDKESSFNRNPYCAYYQRIAHDLICADAVIIVGYSLRDPHIDRLLLNFLELQPTNKVIVIDWRDDNIDPTEEFTNPESFLHRLFIKHNVTGVPVTDTKTLGYKYADQLENTNKVGYGFLYPQIWIYKLGYEKFLSEWQTVIDDWRCS